MGGRNNDNAGRCEICHFEYVFVPDYKATIRYYLRISIFFLTFALWGSVLGWILQALLLSSPEIKSAYGLTDAIPLGKALLVGWYSIVGLIGAVAVLSVLVRLAGPLLVALFLYLNLGDLFVFIICSWPITAVFAAIGLLLITYGVYVYVRHQSKMRARSFRVADLDASRDEIEPEPRIPQEP
jgi:hypothetical protein